MKMQHFKRYETNLQFLNRAAIRYYRNKIELFNAFH